MTAPSPVAAASPAIASPAVAALTGVLPYIDQWLAYRAWKTRTPGVQAAVHFDGRVQLSTAHGHADLETPEPLTPAHLFRVASHSKWFTATAVLQLLERRMLRLDDTAGSFVPRLAQQGSPVAEVTVRELLAHGAGILRDGTDGDFWQLRHPFPDEEELVETLLEARKTSRNDAFNYSNLGYSLLGLIVAAASGVSYAEYVSREIVERLGLTGTGPEWDPARAGEYATGYTGIHSSQTRTPIGHVDTRAMAAATGFYSTASDLVTFAAAHVLGDERLLTDDSKRMQQRDEWRTARASGTTAYGFGLIIDTIDGHRTVGHSGGYPGHITRTLLDPEQGIAVSVLTNAIDGPASEFATGILRLLDLALAREGTLSLVAAEESPVGIDPARLTGRFSNMWGVVDIVAIGEKLVAIDPGRANPLDGLDELVVTGPDTLRIAKGDGFGSIGETMRFEFGPDDRVVSVRGSGGVTLWPLDTATLG